MAYETRPRTALCAVRDCETETGTFIDLDVGLPAMRRIFLCEPNEARWRGGEPLVLDSSKVETHLIMPDAETPLHERIDQHFQRVQTDLNVLVRAQDSRLQEMGETNARLRKRIEALEPKA